MFKFLNEATSDFQLLVSGWCGRCRRKREVLFPFVKIYGLCPMPQDGNANSGNQKSRMTPDDLQMLKECGIESSEEDLL